MKIVVSRPLPGSALDKLKQAGHQMLVMKPERTDKEFLNEAQSADAIVSMLSDQLQKEQLQSFGKQLKVIANYAVGYNNIDVGACSERGIYVCNTPDVLTDATADTTLLLILMSMRRAGESMELLRRGEFAGWRPDLLLGQDLRGKNLGILGMGRIGEAVARRAEAFGMNVMYHTRSGVKYHLPFPAVSLETLIAESDVLSLHCPLTDETKHLLGYQQFKRMKKSAVIINTARGPVIKEEELARALQEKEIYYAGCDVFEKEPLVNEELLKCKNAVLLPHIGSGTIETRHAMAMITVKSILQSFAAQVPEFAVNARQIEID
jgi:glyoxylate reductase